MPDKEGKYKLKRRDLSMDMFDRLPIRNSQIKNFNMLRDKNESKETKKVEIGEDKMFTDDPWFNTGLVIGRNMRKNKSK